jgi:hypothetical protein
VALQTTMTSLIENGMSMQATAAKVASAKRRKASFSAAKIAGISAIARRDLDISDTLPRALQYRVPCFQLDPRS